jgi:hypothetical protein
LRSNSREKREDGGVSDGPKEKCCFKCGKPGHFTCECRSKKKAAQDNLAQEEESALMLVERGEVFERAPSTGGANSNSLAHKVSPTLGTAAGLTGLQTTTPSLVHLIEENVFTQFSDEVKKEGRRWVLDSGASNHMTGVREVFVELNRNICGTVRFGDGSVVEIEGIETVLFGCKNGEHRSLSGVYLIPKLTTNIISLGQLDEVGYKVVINGGVMRVWDEQQRLLMKVLRSSNRLYVQSMEMAQPVSLVMKGAEGAWLWHARYGEFAKHCAEHGVRRQLTTPYTPQQNNVVERRN